MDNSTLTGEYEPQNCTVKCTSENPLETTNLAFFSTNAVEGDAACLLAPSRKPVVIFPGMAKGIVINTGDRTIIGRIAHLTATVTGTRTPIANEIANFTKIITIVAMAFGLTCCIAAILMGYPIVDAVIFLIGIIVANVPEGLPATITVSRSLGVEAMTSMRACFRCL